MILRVTRGVVAAGREAEFAAICRRQVSDLGRAPGLAAFLSGYRRIDGTDQYILAATWDSEDAAVQAAGAQDKPKVVERLDGVASVDSFEVYDLIEPAFRGMVDAPGGVVRFSTGRVSIAGRARFLAWLRNPPRDKAQQIQRLMLGWAIGERHAPDGESVEVVAVSAWPSPLVIEAIADPGRQGAPLYAEMDEFAIDFHVDQYRALALDLPDDMADIGSRRVIAARFAARSAAEATAASLRAAMASSTGRADLRGAARRARLGSRVTAPTSSLPASRSTRTRAPSGSSRTRAAT